jgi:hypothetical protein
MAGDSARAKAAYDDVFLLWKNADADLPALIEANRESAGIKN